MYQGSTSIQTQSRVSRGLYDRFYEHDSCGVGFVADVQGTSSHTIIRQGITILKNLVHRGAVGGDSKTGDGAGMLVQIPHRFFQKMSERPDLNLDLPPAGQYGVGMLFLPLDDRARRSAQELVHDCIVTEGGTLIGWRDVPVAPESLGSMARDRMPHITQVFIAFHGASGDALERRLYVCRKVMEKSASDAGYTVDDFYIPSLSSRNIVYKGLFVAPQFETFFPDLKDPDFTSSFALIHQRYSTNTFPSWALAQPFRFIAHNGEINTLRGNINRMKAREATLSSELFGDDIDKLVPIIDPSLSDSAIFDNVFELLALGGRSIQHAMMMMVPETFGEHYHISADKRAFYEYHAAIMEPWDGPAAIAFTDGVRIGASLDRNGLRPARYVVTKKGLIVLASEVGVLEIPPEDVLRKGKLGPGRMILVDTNMGRILYDHEIKALVSRKQQYRRWLDRNKIELRGLFQVPGPVQVERESLETRQKIFGYTLEDVRMLVTPMAENAQEPVSSMGNDAALAVLSRRPQMLYNYFKQLFAQVTNPPIDPYRESLVMSLMSFIGREENLLQETPAHCHQLKLPHPILSNDDMEKLRGEQIESMRVVEIPILFNPESEDLKTVLSIICGRAERMIDAGASLLVLSDRDVGPSKAPIPALLATSAIHHFLIGKRKRHQAAIIVETGEAREVMHAAILVGYGASAVNPYLVFETIAELIEEKKLTSELTLEQAIENYINGVKKGLLKIMSKMGISTIRSYRGGQIFEAVGLNSELIDTYFPGTSSRIGGVGLDVVERDAVERHRLAYKNEEIHGLDSGGNIHYRNRSEKHLLSPDAIVLLQKAVRTDDYALYKQYAKVICDTSRNLCTLRGLFELKKGRSIPVEKVEPAESIVRRFVTSAMSLGSISKETHETMAIAMNRLGAASNSGEGGEDDERYRPLAGGDSSRSEVKQVASARFGVTSNYLVNCRELQIKISQGAKPGEGGQLPGHKVDEMIARVRHSTPGVMLISPPPHHDIYSIEDLSQLIYDLKNANPRCRVSVKLVAEVGVGTVAAGVAKAKADMVLISGHDGGTGASPVSSIKHAGIPWEIGLAETQQTLVMNGLRDRIRVQTDGQLRTGRDVVIAALLGAEEFGFGTVAVVTLGCIMMRKCHLNTCPVGIATQDPELRKRFAGRPEHLMNFMRFVAQETREIMAELGFATIDEMVGRVDMLDTAQAVEAWNDRELDFSRIFTKPHTSKGGSARSLRCTKPRITNLSKTVDGKIIGKARPALEKQEPVQLSLSIRNRDRTVGAMLSSEVSLRYGSAGLSKDTITCRFTGSAGQSFGAFLAPGIRFELEGDANDYCAKGLSGGTITIRPSDKATFRPEHNIITGNVNLYGATSGEVYINGMAGERFAVRNSGALAVVEGVGDHGCEYMTGGMVVVLGRTGVNFAAGMSGGIAYVLDEDQLFDTKCNLEMVDIEPIMNAKDMDHLHELVERHAEYTGSRYARHILGHWREMLPLFVMVIPIDYRRARERLREQEAQETEQIPVTEEVFI
jgi:glutamate synthase domain-containing protein 2/glutamate synthase domain-containing protein 1/glutamate synthase domain-containing protein 3